ncbi:MAG: twin-arginine translocation signal domain-containing protein, partial [Trebonia sp.]
MTSDQVGRRDFLKAAGAAAGGTGGTPPGAQ